MIESETATAADPGLQQDKVVEKTMAVSRAMTQALPEQDAWISLSNLSILVHVHCSTDMDQGSRGV